MRLRRNAASMHDALARLATPLEDDASLDPLIERVGDARIVMLGEATHGTSEFYSWRARLSMRLVREKGFSFVAVEGDWPDCFRLDEYVKGASGDARALDAVRRFARWPTWMWANHEVAAFLDELRAHNDATRAAKVGFYGLDVYSLWDSMRRVVAQLEETAPDAAQAAREAWACFEPYGEDAQRYARATQVVRADCRDEVVRALAAVERAAVGLDAEQNARVAVNAERYYRTMVEGGAASWNVRDTHMMDTLDHLLAHHGPQAKAIVWEHNTHIGDARATDMADEGMVNIGQLARERHGERDVVLVGFGTHRGSALAARGWDMPVKRMRVPEAPEDSLEGVMHALGGDQLFVLPPASAAASPLLRTIGHRAIGVVYHPEREWGNYVPTVLPRRYDAFVFVDRSNALRPVQVTHEDLAEPETYPWGY
jgi:erythromycin esterase-like protein